MTDISDLLKSTMQNENCSSLSAFLFLKGETQDVEQLHQSASIFSKQISDDKQQYELGARN